MADTPQAAPAVDLDAIDAALKSIEIYPGSSWPSAFDIEGALLRDVYERRAAGIESPWAGGTLAAAKFIANAPAMIKALRAQVEHRHAHYDAALANWSEMVRERDEAVDAFRAALRGLPPTLAAGLLVKLKEECEAQHARAEKAEDALRAALARPSAQHVEAEAILEALQAVLAGESVSDFMGSFPVVRAVQDLVTFARPQEQSPQTSIKPCTCPVERWSARFGDHAKDCPSYIARPQEEK